MPIWAQILVKPFHLPFTRAKPYESHPFPYYLPQSVQNPSITDYGPSSCETPPFAYSLWSPFKIPPLRVMTQKPVKLLHSPVPCEVFLKISPLGVMAQILVKPLQSPIPCEVLLKSVHYADHGQNSSETPPFAYSLWSPFKILPLWGMAHILGKPLNSPIPCELLLKSLHYGSWPKVFWNPFIRLFPVKSF